LDSIVADSPFRLKMISNRGTKVYPPGDAYPDCVDHWRCRFILRDANADASSEQILELLTKISAAHKWMHVEKLLEIDGEPGYTMAQGED
ncbi:MAG: isocitrate dehydrogenase, partial [Defluviitaleaceae bacterium]|nr:isocitrate dehydrogenase [Defluviitaleaceae bacterium]